MINILSNLKKEKQIKRLEEKYGTVINRLKSSRSLDGRVILKKARVMIHTIHYQNDQFCVPNA